MISLLLLSFISFVFAQSSTIENPSPTQPITSIQTDGFNDNNINTTVHQESWLKQHDRYIFIIVLCLLFVAVIIWYIVRSIRGMRKRLAKDNQGQMIMMENTSQAHTFHKMPDYPSAPPANNHQQSYNHRY